MAAHRRRRAGTPPPLDRPPPLQTKVTIVGKNEIYHWENLVGPFLVHTLLPLPPPPPLFESSLPLSFSERHLQELYYAHKQRFRPNRWPLAMDWPYKHYRMDWHAQDHWPQPLVGNVTQPQPNIMKVLRLPWHSQE